MRKCDRSLRRIARQENNELIVTRNIPNYYSVLMTKADVDTQKALFKCTREPFSVTATGRDFNAAGNCYGEYLSNIVDFDLNANVCMAID